jgi:hypothetical protein
MKKLTSILGQLGQNRLGIVALTLLVGTANVARADVIPYPNVGTLNPAIYSFTATSSGNITAYFAGSDAGFYSTLGMLVNGVSTGITGLNNHTSAVGNSINLGSVNAGDKIVFELFVRSTDNSTAVGTIFSDPTLNGPYDTLSGTPQTGHQHIYSTPYTRTSDISGPPANIPLSANIPVGTYVAFEDIYIPGNVTSFPDYDYNDETFIFANVSTSTAPDSASSLALLAFSFMGIALLRRRLCVS